MKQLKLILILQQMNLQILAQECFLFQEKPKPLMLTAISEVTFSVCLNGA